MAKTSPKKVLRNDIVINLKDSLPYLKDYLSDKKLNSRIEKAAKLLSKGIKKKKIKKLNHRELIKTDSKTKASSKKDLDQPAVDPTLNDTTEKITVPAKSTANRNADTTKKPVAKQADTDHNDIESQSLKVKDVQSKSSATAVDVKLPVPRSKKEKVEK